MPSAHLTITVRDRSLPVYLVTVGRGLQNPITRRQGCPDFHWLHTVSGSGMVDMDSGRRTLRPGQGFLMYPDTPCRYWPEQPWDVMWLTFNGVHVEEFLRSWGLPPRFIDLTNSKTLAARISDMLATASDASDHASARLSSLLYTFLVELSWQTSRDRDTLTKRRRLEPVLNKLESQYDQGLTLDDLAAAINITPQHLCRLFRTVLGMTPWNYLTALRISKAKDMLIHDQEWSVAAIGRATGFGNASHFGTAFRRHVGLTPTEFRYRHSFVTSDGGQPPLTR